MDGLSGWSGKQTVNYINKFGKSFVYHNRPLLLASIVLLGLVSSTFIAVTAAYADDSGTCSPNGIVTGGAAANWYGGHGVNVCDNGSDFGDNYGNECVPRSGAPGDGTCPAGSIYSGIEWQCVELVNRFYITQGWISSRWAGNGNSLIYSLPSTLTDQLNGAISYVNPGDVITLNYGSAGHAAVINSGSGTVNIINQNAGAGNLNSTASITSGSLSSGNATYTVSWLGFAVQAFVHHPNKVVGDYDGDGKSNYAVFRESDGTWHYYAGGDNSYQYGSTGDIPAPGYYSGASKVDDAEFRPSNGTWYIRPQGGSGYSFSFGLSGDVPVPSDFDGTGKTNYAVWRPSDGSWHYYSGGDVAHGWGLPGDIPVPGHYSGATKADYAVFRPSTATWYIQPQSGSSYTIAFGQSGDIPAPMIWDAGGKTEPGVFRPSNGTWYYWTPSGTVSHSYGLSGDIPTPGYFSGATKPDYAVFRPSNSSWYIQPQSGSAYNYSFGLSGDVPAIQVLPLPMLQYFGLHS